MDTFIHSMPGGGKTGFALTSYYETETERGGPVIIDFDKGGADGTVVDMGLGGKIPILTPQNEDQVIYIATYPHKIVEMVNKTKGFEDYKVKVFVIDTLSGYEDLVMGEGARATSPDLPATKGYGLMSISRKREETQAPHPTDYKAMMQRSKALMRYLREMPFDTITTCHTVRAATPESPKGLGVEKEYGLYPALAGDDNRVNIGKLHDFWLYAFEAGGKFYFCTTNQKGAIARTKFKNNIDARIEGLKYWDLRKKFDTLRNSG